MIDIKGITKSFGPLQVLKGIDLHIGKGPAEPARPRCCR